MHERGMEWELDRYTEECAELEDDYQNYSLYINGYWIPWLESQRKQIRWSLAQGQFDIM